MFLFTVLYLSPIAAKGQNSADTSGKGTTAVSHSVDSQNTGVLHSKAIQQRADTLVKPVLFQPNPKKAGLYSAIVPGLGQLYNRNYWKIPVVYAGLGTAVYILTNNLNKYQSYRKAYIGRINNPYPTDDYVNIYTLDQLKQLQNDYNKYVDMTILYTAIGYTLQIVDAIVSAHLKNFDISRDISMQVKPVAYPKGAGVGLVMNF